MADGSVTRTDAPKTAAEAQRGTRRAGWSKALTSPLGFFTGFMGTRYESSFEASSAVKPAEQPKSSLWARFTGAVGSVKDSIASALEATKKSVQERGALGTLGDLAGRAWGGIKAAGQWVADGVAGITRTIIDAASNAISTVTSFLSKVWNSFSLHQKDVERRLDEQRRDEERREELRVLEKRDESKRLEDAVQRARAIAKAQEFQAEQGLVDKITATAPNSQLDNAALERKREREKAQKAAR